MTSYGKCAIIGRAERTGWGQDYIDDCDALGTLDPTTWRLTFTEDALAELRATWNETTPKQTGPARPCGNCRGL